MKSLTPLATLLMFLLWAPLSVADSGALNSHSEAGRPVIESAYGSPASEDSSLAGLIPAAVLPNSAEGGEGFSDTLQSLSPLAVLALGIVGLFWVRKHTAEL